MSSPLECTYLISERKYSARGKQMEFWWHFCLGFVCCQANDLHC